MKNGERTLLLPATNADPSDAIETDRIGTSSSGSCFDLT
jgi:hypothetical protein